MEQIIIGVMGGKKSSIPKPVKPPPPGWFEEAEAKQRAREERARRWIEAHT
nr:MAG TPA: hypothetical protein [Bacteriophage sp.]